MDKIYKIAIAVVMFVIGILGCGYATYNTFHVPLANAICQERVERAIGDDKLSVCMYDIRMTLVKISTDLDYLKQRQNVK